MSNLILDANGTGIGATANLTKSNISDLEIKNMLAQVETDQLAYAASELEANKGRKNPDSKAVQANGYTVIFTKYSKNPYRPYYKSMTGLITDVGIEGNEFQFSHNTGEMEKADLGIICAHVISVGPECKYIKEGDDVYLRNIGTAPVPFNGKGYWAISEQNIICKIVDND